MKGVSAFEFYERCSAGEKIPPLAHCRALDAHCFSQIKDAVSTNGLEFHAFDVDAKGPSAAVEAAGSTMSLFGGGSFLWLKLKKSPSSWTDDSKHRFDQLKAQADGQSLFLMLELPSDKRVKLSKGFSDFVELSSDLSQSESFSWLRSYAQKKQCELSEDKLKFLMAFEEQSLMTKCQWVDLWALGGDLWAEEMLAWGLSQREKTFVLEKGQNPAFSWVDAVLRKDKRRGLLLMDRLLAQGQDPIQLCALLSKSARIAASLAARESVQGQPSFLVNKLRSVDSRWSVDLLKQCASIDRKLKSTASDARALLSQLF